MRFFDLGVAALIGISAITSIYVLSPGGSDSAAQRVVEQTRLRDALLTVLARHGLAWIQNSSPSNICGTIAALSNSTVTFSASIDSMDCLEGPPPGRVSANITLGLPSGSVTLVAWSSG